KTKTKTIITMYGKIKDYYGNYTEYKIEKEKQKKIEKQREKAKNNHKKQISKPTTNVQKLNYKEKKELKTIEEEIENLENEKKDILEEMNNGDGESLNILNLSRRYEEVEKILEDKTARWFTLKEKEEI
ncbi:MAG TPA: hypothetical protein PK548_03865, partial [Bacteroidales bacterium]|nr:hypothetical protein [Bacteroidales bacterium]